ncbi:hypothetical protein HRED_10512 [Candidatus Haloredivivus sp. G17]|nr:hypothetical protein HRED_10512 [Candidatus Haloredivivus sp. G17]
MRASRNIISIFMNKNSGREYEAQAIVENEQTANWEVQEI